MLRPSPVIESLPELSGRLAPVEIADLETYVKSDTARFAGELPFVYRAIRSVGNVPGARGDWRLSHGIAPTREINPFHGITGIAQVEALLAGELEGLHALCRLANLTYRLLARAWALDDWLAMHMSRPGERRGVAKQLFLEELKRHAAEMGLANDPAAMPVLDRWPTEARYFQDMFDYLGIMRRAGYYLRGLEAAAANRGDASAHPVRGWRDLTDAELESIAASVLAEYPIGTTMTYARQRRDRAGAITNGDPRMRLKPSLSVPDRHRIITTELGDLRAMNGAGQWFFRVEPDEWTDRALNSPKSNRT